MKLIKIGINYFVEFTDNFGKYSFAFEEEELKELQGILNKHFAVKERTTLRFKTQKGKKGRI